MKRTKKAKNTDFFVGSLEPYSELADPHGTINYLNFSHNAIRTLPDLIGTIIFSLYDFKHDEAIRTWHTMSVHLETRANNDTRFLHLQQPTQLPSEFTTPNSQPKSEKHKIRF